MAKLTGAKKKAFLERMAKGRKKAKRANPKKKATAKRKATTKRKPAKKATPRKLTGAKKAEFLRRMERGRKKASRGNVKNGRPAKRSRRRNSEADAEAMYETFHGKAPGRILSYEEENNYQSHFAELGKLIELQIDLDRENPDYPFTHFGDCLVVATTNGENIYFIGGDQSVNLANLDIGAEKDFIELGPCGYIAYRTEKHQFHDFSPRTYEHFLGEENGIKPMLCYDRLNRKLFFAGGDYHVKREGITN